jgi:hypothetical protein
MEVWEYFHIQAAIYFCSNGDFSSNTFLLGAEVNEVSIALSSHD